MPTQDPLTVHLADQLLASSRDNLLQATSWALVTISHNDEMVISTRAVDTQAEALLIGLITLFNNIHKPEEEEET